VKLNTYIYDYLQLLHTWICYCYHSNFNSCDLVINAVYCHSLPVCVCVRLMAPGQCFAWRNLQGSVTHQHLHVNAQWTTWHQSEPFLKFNHISVVFSLLSDVMAFERWLTSRLQCQFLNSQLLDQEMITFTVMGKI